jgi:hypothetical protein
LEQRRSQLADYQTVLQQAGEETNDGRVLGERLALDYGRVLAAAETVWLDSKLSQLCRSPRESTAEEAGSA